MNGERERERPSECDECHKYDLCSISIRNIIMLDVVFDVVIVGVVIILIILIEDIRTQQ